MNDLELDKLNNYYNKLLVKYDLLKGFEIKYIGNNFKVCLDKGFSQENPKYKYVNYLRYYFLPFAFEKKIISTDLASLAVIKNEIGLIFYSIYKIAQSIEEINPREVQDWFFQAYIALEQISDKPKEDITFFFDKGLLKSSQIKLFNEFLNDLDRRYQAFIGSYDIVKEPYFHFKMKPF